MDPTHRRWPRSAGRACALTHGWRSPQGCATGGSAAGGDATSGTTSGAASGTSSSASSLGRWCAHPAGPHDVATLTPPHLCGTPAGPHPTGWGCTRVGLHAHTAPLWDPFRGPPLRDPFRGTRSVGPAPWDPFRGRDPSVGPLRGTPPLDPSVGPFSGTPSWERSHHCPRHHSRQLSHRCMCCRSRRCPRRHSCRLPPAINVADVASLTPYGTPPHRCGGARVGLRAQISGRTQPCYGTRHGTPRWDLSLGPLCGDVTPASATSPLAARPRRTVRPCRGCRCHCRRIPAAGEAPLSASGAATSGTTSGAVSGTSSSASSVGRWCAHPVGPHPTARAAASARRPAHIAFGPHTPLTAVGPPWGPSMALSMGPPQSGPSIGPFHRTPA